MICTISSDWYGLVKILQRGQAVKVKENMLERAESEALQEHVFTVTLECDMTNNCG